MANKAFFPVIYLKKNPTHSLWLSALMALIIVVLSLTPLPELPEVPGSDKTHHLIAYAALAFPASIASQRVWRFACLYILLGGVIELIQPYVNRHGEVLDVIANGFGVLLGVIIGLTLNRIVTE